MIEPRQTRAAVLNNFCRKPSAAPKIVAATGTSTNLPSTMASSHVDETHSVATGTHARIRPPTTTNDDGNPTESISLDAKRIFRLIEDERHLVAQTLYHSVLDRLDQSAAQSPASMGVGKPKKLHLRPLHNRRHQQEIQKHKSSERKEHEKARLLLEANVAILEKLEVMIVTFLNVESGNEMETHILIASIYFQLSYLHLSCDCLFSPTTSGTMSTFCNGEAESQL